MYVFQGVQAYGTIEISFARPVEEIGFNARPTSDGDGVSLLYTTTLDSYV